MSLTSGTRLGTYEILSAIGVGGMGEVYRARDTKLDRDVAVKILPDAFTADAERVARFQREAKVLASLNHQNIATIHGLEDANGVHALVMELVEGEDLAHRLARGAIPLDEALPIGKQIADALEAAHEQGIIHRDLKPANIKVRPDGGVKVLDFGLAKALEQVTSGSGNALASPTITSPAMTGVGTILGTVAYMSPEQAKGRAADKRSDVWAFGVVLYEMLAGRRAFAGDDIAETLAAVLRQDLDWTALPPSTPESIRRLLARCLDRDTKRRLRDIGEARIVLEDPASATGRDLPALPTSTGPHSSSRSTRVAWLVAALSTTALLATIAFIASRPSSVPSNVGATQFTIVAPDNTSFGGPPEPGTGRNTQVAISPDGRNIVFVAGAQTTYRIWMRPVGTLTATPIPGTEGGAFPFWSPDSRFIGFFAAGKLKKVAIAGGPAIVLCDAGGRGGSWSRDNVIVFASVKPAGLHRVSSAGGLPTAVTTIDPATGEDNHRWPHFLPDGKHFFYTAITGACCPAVKPSTIKIASLDSSEVAVSLLQAESPASYSSGHLFFARDNTLMAQPFDPEARRSTGDAFPVAEHVRPEGSRYVGASVSANGTLVYANDDGLESRQLAWFDRTGKSLASLGDAGVYSDLALSTDGRRVAISLATGSPENQDIWIIDVARNIRSRLTTDAGSDRSPLWSRDGTQIAFEAERSGKVSIRRQSANGTGADELLFEVADTPSRPCGAGQCSVTPSSWSADGRYIAYTLGASFPQTTDMWILPLFGDRKPWPLANTSFREGSATFSPDGKSIAYVTTEPGQPNVYVQPFPGAGGKYRVSPNGGSQPQWRADGKELFYVGADGTLMTVPIDADGQLDARGPQALFPTGSPASNFFRQLYAATKDGQRFLVNAPPQQSSSARVTVVVNWPATIRK